MSSKSKDSFYQSQHNLNGIENEWMDWEGKGDLDALLKNEAGTCKVQIGILSDESELIWDRHPKEKMKTALAALMLIFSCILVGVSTLLVHERLPDREIYKPLPDVILDNVEAQDWALSMSDIFATVSTFTVVTVLMLHRHRWIVFRRVFLLFSCLYFMRALTMYVTVLPVSSLTYYCSPKSKSDSATEFFQRFLKLSSSFAVSISGQYTFCGDYIFSGHTIIFVIAYLTVQEYTPRRFSILHWTSFSLSFAGVALMLLSHGHYTIDVIIAYYVTTRLFWTYHTLANNPQLKVPRGQSGSINNLFSRVWWFPVFYYMEKNVNGVVPREYSFPWSSKQIRHRQRTLKV